MWLKYSLFYKQLLTNYKSILSKKILFHRNRKKILKFIGNHKFPNNQINPKKEKAEASHFLISSFITKLY